MGLTLLSGQLTAEKAAEWGLIWKCVDDATLNSCIDEITGKLAGSPRLALAYAKRALYASLGNSLNQQLDLERDLLRELGQTSITKMPLQRF